MRANRSSLAARRTSRKHSHSTVPAHPKSGRSWLLKPFVFLKKGERINRAERLPICLGVIQFTGRSHSCCDSIPFLKRLTPDGFISCLIARRRPYLYG